MIDASLQRSAQAEMYSQAFTLVGKRCAANLRNGRSARLVSIYRGVVSFALPLAVAAILDKIVGISHDLQRCLVLWASPATNKPRMTLLP